MRHLFALPFRLARELFSGGRGYFLWSACLLAVALLGLNAYCKQLAHGLALTGMMDQVPWGLYISNFTFLVGLAAAAVMLVIPAYLYHDEPLHEVVVLGELLAIAAIAMCLLFVTVDLGRPDRFWHLVPGLGILNWPGSMLAWDVVVLNGYLALNVYICSYLLWCAYMKREPKKPVYMPAVFIAIVWAISIHTVTAFLYSGLGGRPFWNSAVIAPRFLASAFTSGPAFIILALQLIRRFTPYPVSDAALMRLRAIIQVSMAANIFLMLCEVFTEFYPHTAHAAHAKYLFFGLRGHSGLVPWIWTAIALNSAAFLLLLSRASRGFFALNLACVLSVAGIWIEKGMGFVIPGFIPTTLGEVLDYLPTRNEALIAAGVWAFGLLLYTALVKMAVPVLLGSLNKDN